MNIDSYQLFHAGIYCFMHTTASLSIINAQGSYINTHKAMLGTEFILTSDGHLTDSAIKRFANAVQIYNTSSLTID